MALSNARSLQFVLLSTTLIFAGCGGSRLSSGTPTTPSEPATSNAQGDRSTQTPSSQLSQPTPDFTASRSAEGLYIFDTGSNKFTKVSDALAYATDWAADGTSVWYANRLYPSANATRSEVHRLVLQTLQDDLLMDLQGGGFVSLNAAAGRAAFVRYEGSVKDPASIQGGRIEYTAHIANAGGRELDLGSGLPALLSPDGSKVMIVSPACGDRPSLRVLDAGSGAEIASAPGVFNFTLQWIDDVHISFRRLSDGSTRREEGVVLDLASGATALDTRAGGAPADAVQSISPNGRVAVINYLGQRLLRELGTGQQQLLGFDSDGMVAWTHDSPRFAYITNKEISVIGSNGAVLGTQQLPWSDQRFVSPASVIWSPDDKRLLFGVSASTGRGTCD